MHPTTRSRSWRASRELPHGRACARSASRDLERSLGDARLRTVTRTFAVERAARRPDRPFASTKDDPRCRRRPPRMARVEPDHRRHNGLGLASRRHARARAYRARPSAGPSKHRSNDIGLADGEERTREPGRGRRLFAAPVDQARPRHEEEVRSTACLIAVHVQIASRESEGGTGPGYQEFERLCRSDSSPRTASSSTRLHVDGAAPPSSRSRRSSTAPGERRAGRVGLAQAGRGGVVDARSSSTVLHRFRGVRRSTPPSAACRLRHDASSSTGVHRMTRRAPAASLPRTRRSEQSHRGPSTLMTATRRSSIESGARALGSAAARCTRLRATGMA